VLETPPTAYGNALGGMAQIFPDPPVAYPLGLGQLH
jgi:hypothetical protein